MGLFDWVRRSNPKHEHVDNAAILSEEDCTELVAVVGESHYQDALHSLCGSDRWEDVAFACVAALVPEPSNSHDPNAVMIQIEGRCVGYLSRGDAVDYQPMIAAVMDRGLFLAARARIAGRGPGSDTQNLGVFLKLPPPDETIEF